MLVCGADALSRITDHDDRGTAVLFGDGAGAVVVAGGELELGVARFVSGSDPSQGEALYAETDERMLRMAGPTSTGTRSPGWSTPPARRSPPPA